MRCSGRRRMLKYRVPHGSQPRHGWAPDPPMVGIRSPIGLVVGSCTSHPGVLVSIPNERNQGKQDATLFYSTGFLTGPKETRRSLARNGPMVRATFWNSKLSTPRNHRHWFCIVAIFTHVLSNRQVPGSSQPNRRATRCLGEIWISDCMLQRLHARLLPLRIRILHTLTHTEFG